jgi:methionyl-tRNA synthetase
MTRQVTVIVIPQPTVNGPLHIGHLSGPYLAADIASRAARARGERVLTMAGVDVHPNYVLTKAENLGVDVDEMIGTYRGQIMKAYEYARIGYDWFLDPQDPVYQESIASTLTELVVNGTVPMQEMTLHQCSDCGRTLHHSYVVGKCAVCGTGANGTSCEGCGGFTSAQLLVDASCARCGGSPRPMPATVPVLRLEDYRQRLVDEWLMAEWPDRVRSVLKQYQHQALPDIPLAYPTNWGIQCSGPLDGMRVDFPTELGFSYFCGPARALDPNATTLAARLDAWREIGGVWHFNGMDNTFYFAVLYPAILAAVGVPRPTALGATVNELYLLEGKKFSTSRNHALWADEFLSSEDPEMVRLFLSWDRPDRYETDFTDRGFRAFSDYLRALLADEPTGSAAALHLVGFDAALAIRCLVAALTAGRGRDSVVMTALAGRPTQGSASTPAQER